MKNYHFYMIQGWLILILAKMVQKDIILLSAILSITSLASFMFALLSKQKE